MINFGASCYQKR